MKRFRKILVLAGGKDGGVAAVDQAADLAERSSAKVAVVDCVDRLPDMLDVAGTAAADSHQALVDRKLADLGRLAQTLRDRHVSVVYELMQGDVAEKVVDRVIREGHDLLIKSAEQPAGLAQRLFGTVGQRLMRKCPCPVWIIKTPVERRLNRILVAVDPTPIDEKRNPMNIKMMELSTSMAETNQCELHVVYVWPRWTEWSNSASGQTVGIAAEKAIVDGNSLQERMLEALVGRFRGGDHAFTTHLLKGDPGDTIANLAAKLNADLLVMGTVCRTNFKFFSIGNTAERVLDQVNCSVLTVKPDVFLSQMCAPSNEGINAAFTGI